MPYWHYSQPFANSEVISQDEVKNLVLCSECNNALEHIKFEWFQNLKDDQFQKLKELDSIEDTIIICENCQVLFIGEKDYKRLKEIGFLPFWIEFL